MRSFQIRFNAFPVGSLLSRVIDDWKFGDAVIHGRLLISLFCFVPFALRSKIRAFLFPRLGQPRPCVHPPLRFQVRQSPEDGFRVFRVRAPLDELSQSKFRSHRRARIGEEIAA